jgi:hypothetical protein
MFTVPPPVTNGLSVTERRLLALADGGASLHVDVELPR